jgi:Rha family phage regulatory protein
MMINRKPPDYSGGFNYAPMGATPKKEEDMTVEIRMMGKEETAVVTSLDVAETFGKEHAHVLRDIRNLECSAAFRASNFGCSFYLSEQNKKMPMILITRDGFSFLAMGYTGEKAARFKESYIKQFNSMEKALRGKVREREKGIAVRQALTKAIQQSSENERMHGHAYSVYTDIVYKAVFGKGAKQLREEYGIGKTDTLRDCFAQEELAKIQSVEMIIGGLVDCGWGYDEIKHFALESKRRLIADKRDIEKGA